MSSSISNSLVIIYPFPFLGLDNKASNIHFLVAIKNLLVMQKVVITNLKE
jgi:hypothetical protein